MAGVGTRRNDIRPLSPNLGRPGDLRIVLKAVVGIMANLWS